MAAEASGPAGLDDVVDVLYAVPPQDFVARRTEAAAEAKAAGDKALAKAVAGLRRPARSAWVLNQLARAEPEALGELGELGEELRAAEREMKGPELRKLSGQRTKLVDRLATTALRAAEVADGDADLRREVQETLTAALAEPAVLDGLRTGALVKPVAWSGFGVSGLEDITAVPVTSRSARTQSDRSQSESKASKGTKADTTEPRSAKGGAAGAKRAAVKLAEPAEDAPRGAAPRTAATEDRGTTARERAAQREQERRERQHAERVDAAERDLAEAEVVYAGAKSEAAEAAAEVARLEAALRTARSESTSAQRETDRARRARDSARTTLTRVRARRP